MKNARKLQKSRAVKTTTKIYSILGMHDKIHSPAPFKKGTLLKCVNDVTFKSAYNVRVSMYVMERILGSAKEGHKETQIDYVLLPGEMFALQQEGFRVTIHKENNETRIYWR